MEVNHIPQISHFGDKGLLVSWKSVIDDIIHKQIQVFDAFIQSIYSEDIIETVSTYSALAVYFPDSSSRDAIGQRLIKDWHSYDKKAAETPSFLVEIPVCYDEEFAPDISKVAKHNGISEAAIISLHTKPVYKLYFTGFLPGFPYLGGLDERLHTPRLENPRPLVSMGAVGIGGGQTGVYTQDSPGGWNIIGRTPVHFFNPRKEPWVIATAGDFVKFTAVDRKEFDNTVALVVNESYQLNRTPYAH